MSIRTTGKKVSKLNCYYTYVKSKSDIILVAKSVNDFGVSGKYYINDEFRRDASIPFKWIHSKNVSIVHYYKGNEFQYKSMIDFYVNGFTQKDKIIAICYKYFSIVFQFFYNRKRLVMVKRHELLKVLVQYHINNAHEAINLIDLMTKMHLLNWVDHPKADEGETELELYLKSLVETGEVKEKDTGYIVTGSAIKTIEDYEHAERRHRDNVRIQRAMVIITAVLALFSLIQAEIIKFPTLVDLSKLLN